MKRNYPRTYRSRRPLKIAFTILLFLVIAAVVLTVSLFFGLRQYVVYDQEGNLHLEIPWLEEDTTD